MWAKLGAELTVVGLPISCCRNGSGSSRWWRALNSAPGAPLRQALRWEENKERRHAAVRHTEGPGAARRRCRSTATHPWSRSGG